MARHRPFDRVVINGVWYDAYVEYSSDAGGTFNAGDPVYVDTDHPGIAFTQEGIRWLNLAQATFSILNKIDISHHSRRFLEPFHDTRTVGAQYVNPSHKGAHLVAVDVSTIPSWWQPQHIANFIIATATFKDKDRP